MIYRESILFDAPKDVQTAFYYLNNRLFIYDSFVFATSDSQLEEIEKYEKRINHKLTKPNWIREIKSKSGVVFFIQHGSKRFKSIKHVDWAIDELKTQYDSTLLIERFDKYEKFDVFFIGLKKANTKQVENETSNENQNANQTI
jgi:hypothetical protein